MFISVKEAAQILNVKEATLYLWSERGDIPSYKFGRLVRFKKADIETWAESKKMNATPAKPVPHTYTSDIKRLIARTKESVLSLKSGKAGIASEKGGG